MTKSELCNEAKAPEIIISESAQNIVNQENFKA